MYIYIHMRETYMGERYGRKGTEREESRGRGREDRRGKEGEREEHKEEKTMWWFNSVCCHGLRVDPFLPSSPSRFGQSLKLGRVGS